MLSKLDEYRNSVINIISKEKEIKELEKMIEIDKERILNIVRTNTENRLTVMNKMMGDSINFTKRLSRAVKYVTKKDDDKTEEEMDKLRHQLNMISIHDNLIIEKTKMEIEVEEEKQGLKDKREMAAIEQRLEHLNSYEVNGMNLQNTVYDLEIGATVVLEDDETMVIDEEFAKIGLMYLSELMPNSGYMVKEKAVKMMFSSVIKEYSKNMSRNPIEVLNAYLNYDLSVAILDEAKIDLINAETVDFETVFRSTGWVEPMIGDYGYDMESGKINAPITAVLSVVQAEVHDRMEALNQRISKIAKMDDKQKTDIFVLSSKKYVKRYGFHELFTIPEQKNLIMLNETLDNVKIMAKIELAELEEEYEQEKFA